MPIVNRVSFLVDGFNVYHSAKEARHALGGTSTLWLDLPSLLSSYLSILGKEAQFEEIYYFSALATHMDSVRPGTTTRHRAYLDCLRGAGAKIELGRFKRKGVWCKKCRVEHEHFEEKETDVAISIKLIELFHLDLCDTVVLVTGDTDLAPAVRTASRLFPTKQVVFAFPFKRKNRELAKLVATSFRMKKEMYAKFQFPEPFVMPSGRSIAKPSPW